MTTSFSPAQQMGFKAIVSRFIVAVLVASLALVVSFVLSGCSGQSASSSTSESSTNGQEVTFTDDLGRSVTVNANPQRVVAGMGSFADMWQLAGGTLAGAPDEAFTDYNIDASKVSSIGAFSGISQEAILSLNPDFVILTGNSTGQAGAVSQTDLETGLTDAGVPVAYFKVTTFDDYLRVLKTMCDITGNEEQYQQNGADVQQAVQKTIDTYKDAAQSKTYLLGITYSQGVRPQRSDSQTGAMLSDLGAVNIVDSNQGLLSDFSVEALLEADPDYIFLVPMGSDEDAAKASLDTLTSNKAWNSLSAVKNDQVVILSRDLYVDKPNARWAEAYEGLGKAFK